MNQAVAIVTHPSSREPLDLLLASLDRCRWPLVVVVNDAERADEGWLCDIAQRATVLTRSANGYEIGAISAILVDTDIDEFVLFQDTFEVLDSRFLDPVFAFDGTVLLTVAGFHYHLKWRRDILATLPIPTVSTKAESVRYESEFTRMYLAAEAKPVWTFDEHFHDGEHAGFEERFGRRNMVLRNEHYIKRKGDWGQRPL